MRADNAALILLNKTRQTGLPPRVKLSTERQANASAEWLAFIGIRTTVTIIGHSRQVFICFDRASGD
jgi:hypothetical protein